ncbi:MAG: hypothetical protein GY822_31850 [Deltaproteobacteria bacterium]|nr:hypothetical protein [Deltaproteobacteria bacterium]
MNRPALNRSAILLLAVAAAFSAACSNQPSDACVQYVDCQNAYTEAFGGTDVDISEYEAGGACWDNSRIAETCTVNCENAVVNIVNVTGDTDEGTPAECE